MEELSIQVEVRQSGGNDASRKRPQFALSWVATLNTANPRFLLHPATASFPELLNEDIAWIWRVQQAVGLWQPLARCVCRQAAVRHLASFGRKQRVIIIIIIQKDTAAPAAELAHTQSRNPAQFRCRRLPPRPPHSSAGWRSPGLQGTACPSSARRWRAKKHAAPAAEPSSGPRQSPSLMLPGPTARPCSWPAQNL